MKPQKLFFLIYFLLGMILVLTACSNSKSPVIPESDNSEIAISQELNTDCNRGIVAVYDAAIDVEAGTFTIEPVTRESSFHFPLTTLYPNVLQITAFGFTPTFWADIRLSHPFPGSGIDGFDARVIACLPANMGVSMYYPEFDLHANNSVILFEDGYTKLFDNPSIPGNANPFIAYFTSEPNRVWSSTGMTSETLHWLMDLAGFGGPLQFQLVVDVSTNYPAPPQPGPRDHAGQGVADLHELESAGVGHGGRARRRRRRPPGRVSGQPEAAMRWARSASISRSKSSAEENDRYTEAKRR